VTIAYEPTRCVVCGNADATSLAESDDIRAEVEWLWAFHERRLHPGTPPSRLVDRIAFSEHPPLRLVRCRGCGLVYRNPAERPHELTEVYARQSPEPEMLQSLHDTQLASARRQARRLRAQFGRSGSGLEVGSYVGAFLTAAREVGLECKGVDVNPIVNAFARSRGFAVYETELACLPGERAVDVIAIWNAFDQLVDPRGTLLAAQRLLRPGGSIVLRVPNGAFYAAMRPHLRSPMPPVRAIARELLAQNNLLSFPYRWGFSPESLTRLLRETGFERERIYGDVLVPTADEHTRVWAALEEKLIKRTLGAAVHRAPSAAPWIEIYARRR
jgi:SAM-dependent methyltransferase